MRWIGCMMVTVLALTGCATSPAVDDAEAVAEAEADAQADAEAASRAVDANRAAVVRSVQALPGVGAAEVSVGTGVGGAGAATVAVTVVRDDGRPVDDALAQRVVERVLSVFEGVSPSNVAVRDGGQGGYLYIGDIGRIE